MNVFDSGRIRPARQGEIPPPVQPAAPVRWKVLRSNLIDRMTNAEAAAYRTLLNTMPVKVQERWAAVRWVWNDDQEVRAAGAAMGWTAGRLDQLLAFDPDAEGVV